MLAVINESDALMTALFYLFALMSAGSALGVVIARNIVRMSVCLLMTLMGVAGLYFLLSAEFLAAVQLVVYAGGTLILIVFGVMLTSKSPFSRFDPKGSEVLIATIIGLVLFGAMIAGVLNLPNVQQGTASPAGGYPMDRLGQALLGDYLVPFEIASVLLLVVMIGAAYLAKGRKHDPSAAARPNELSQKARQWS